jgi:hypothetical protein
LSPSVCAGSSISLIAVGALTYSWSQGGSAPIVVVTPGANTTYSVTGFNQFGCKGVATISITAVPYPVLSTTAPSAPVCANTTVTLTAGGASSYNWSNGSTAQALVVTPAATTSYTVTGNNSGCETSAVVTVSVDACLSLSETSWGSAKVFPNPVSDVINIVPANGEMLKFELTNSLGQILRQGEISGASKINISALPGSVYFLTLLSAGKSETVSIVKE